MSNETRGLDRLFLHLHLGIPLDFVIRYSDLGMVVHGKPPRHFCRALGPRTVAAAVTRRLIC